MAKRQSPEVFMKKYPLNSKIGTWRMVAQPSIKEVVYHIKCECECGATKYLELDKLDNKKSIKCLQCLNIGVLIKPNPEVIIENNLIKIPLQGKHSNKFVIFDIGDLDVVKNRKWYCKSSARCDYARTIINGKSWYAHQLILKSKDFLLDHIDNDGLNNSRSNLRICIHKDNVRNKTKARGKTSKFYGVCLGKNGKWRSTLYVDWKQVHSKEFHTEIEAAIDHDTIARKLHGEFAKLNFPNGEDL